MPCSLLRIRERRDDAVRVTSVLEHLQLEHLVRVRVRVRARVRVS